MWRLPLPEIKEAIIKKTKELGDDLVYDTTATSHHKLISGKESGGKEINLTPASEAEPRVVHHIELTSAGPGSAWTGTLTSTIQRRSAACKQACSVCQQVVFLLAGGDSGGGGGGGIGEQAVADQDVGEDEGLKCRSCCRVRHYKCDALSRLEFASLRSVSRRYICSSCLDLAIRSWKEKHVSSIGETCGPDVGSVAADDGSKGLKETEVMPSKEEMKQMIREVVDDVIRSTISQVINQKVLLSCSACSGSDSSGSGCECKVLPSVTSLDKQAEEETKKTKSEDLLLLLKSPDVEVKHFLPSCKAPTVDPLDSIAQDIELKKREILESLVSLKSGVRSALSPKSHRGNQAVRGYGDDGTVPCITAQQCSPSSPHHQQQEDDACTRDDLQDEILEIGGDADEGKGHQHHQDDYDAEDEDGGEYESIRFDREDLESKACLGFAHLDLDVDKSCVEDAGHENAAHDREHESDMKPSAPQMPIKLNQVDLSEFMSIPLSAPVELSFYTNAIRN